jgi:hypothetical protein
MPAILKSYRRQDSRRSAKFSKHVEEIWWQSKVSLVFHSWNHALHLSGFSEAKVDKIREAARKLDPRGGAFKVGFFSNSLHYIRMVWKCEKKEEGLWKLRQGLRHSMEFLVEELSRLRSPSYLESFVQGKLNSVILFVSHHRWMSKNYTDPDRFIALRPYARRTRKSDLSGSVKSWSKFNSS